MLQLWSYSFQSGFTTIGSSKSSSSDKPDIGVMRQSNVYIYCKCEPHTVVLELLYVFILCRFSFRCKPPPPLPPNIMFYVCMHQSIPIARYQIAMVHSKHLIESSSSSLFHSTMIPVSKQACHFPRVWHLQESCLGVARQGGLSAVQPHVARNEEAEQARPSCNVACHVVHSEPHGSTFTGINNDIHVV